MGNDILTLVVKYKGVSSSGQLINHKRDVACLLLDRSVAFLHRSCMAGTESFTPLGVISLDLCHGEKSL